MGNCCLKGSRSSSMVWAESDNDENDQWVYYSDPNLQKDLLSEEKTQKSSVPDHEITNNNNGNKSREVKIMLSKKKLEELLGKVEDLQHIPVDQIFDHLIDASDRLMFDDDHNHHNLDQQLPPWKPNLTSIPEEN